MFSIEMAVILILAFIVVVFLVSFVRNRKNRIATDRIDNVKAFHNIYGKKDAKDQSAAHRSVGSKKNPGSFGNYVTRYNSQEDYREK